MKFAALRRLAELMGTGVESDESVPVALAVASVCRGNVWHAAQMGATLGGDADTIAGLAAAVVAATTGLSAPVEVLSAIDQDTLHEVSVLAAELLDV
jgi:ADP-ribosylglycohydrolase